MNLLLRDKKALVTAASKGIGQGVALALAREGCQVIITSSNQENLAQAVSVIETEAGMKAAAYVMDVSSATSIRDATRRILGDYQGIDILVTNSPGPTPTEAATVDLAAFQSALYTNLMSVVQLCRTFLPGMIERGFGRIINLTSSTGKEPDEGMVLSNVTRAGVLAYAKTLSREVAKHGVTVNSILTGSVMTERAIKLLQGEAQALDVTYEEILAQAAQSIPAGYICTTEQFCHAIAFLASPLSMYVNGVSLAIDGGYMKAI